MTRHLRSFIRVSPIIGAAIAILASPRLALAGPCLSAELCEDPCPAENSCPRDGDCPERMICAPSCLPSSCLCSEHNEWSCSDDCVGECVQRPPWPGPPSYLIIDLGTLGGPNSVGLGINNQGQVVGGADTPDGYRHAFLWHQGQMTDLSTLPGDRWSEAYDVNNIGYVVGISSVTTGAWNAFLWRDRVLINLGHLGVVRDTRAYAINDFGQIVGAGTFRSQRHAFLMTPLDADFNDDGSTDLGGVCELQSCLTGRGILVDPACKMRDLNRDGNVDLVDASFLQWVFGDP